MKDKLFVYQDARGEITGRILTEVSETEMHLQGYCLSANALRTFRKDRILEYVNTQEQLELLLEHFLSNAPPPRNPSTKPSPSLGQYEVCFTGFRKAEKEQLAQKAEEIGMFIRGSVSKKLDFLCYGYNAGPKKLEKARLQGVLILNEEQFLNLLESGEVPEDD